MEDISINLLSVLAAAISAFALGGLWYGPLFGKAWIEAFDIDVDKMAKLNMVRIYGLAFVLSLIAALNLELFIGAEATLAFGTAAGFAAGFGWVATFLGILYLFENQSLKAYLVNAGYCVVALTLMGAILGAW